MSKTQSDLRKVQDLYLLQVELWGYMDSDPLSPERRKEARERLRAFSSLLRQANPSYMGGEDVLQGLQSMEMHMKKKLLAPAKAGRTHSSPKKSGKKITMIKAAPKKKTVMKKKKRK